MTSIRRIKSQKLKNIVIMGGSHSGFSAAWILINGPANLWHNTSVNTTCKKNHKEGTPYQFPGAMLKTGRNCSECCVCKKDVSPSKSSSKGGKKPSTN